ncbi:MAG: hypothetical protein IMF19_16795 [Proteobacteria bacterium]|nr:hypothetical protein [Pseudomonadota bacterium]
MNSGMAVVRANARFRQILAEKDRIINGFELEPNSKYRATTKVVKRVLLDGPYRFKNKAYEVRAKSLGAGVYELSAELKNG